LKKNADQLYLVYAEMISEQKPCYPE